MQDRPTIAELLEAVRDFLERDVVDALEGTTKFHARVAVNVLGIALRELEMEPAHLAAEWRRLDALLGAAAPPEGLNALRDGKRSFLVITHYQRLLDYIKPDVVHILAHGKIIKTGGPELALELEAKGYADFVGEAA